MQRPREWLEETHSAAFELRRHFFLRFFDSDLVSTPGQWQVVASGVLAILLSLSLVYTQAYYHKYLELNALPTPDPQRLATVADVLFLITLAMALIGLFTTLQWPSLFPGLRDYLALGSLPVRMREVFVAKFAALVAFASLFIVAITLLPSAILPTVMAGRYSPNILRQVPAIFVSSSLAALFVFFSLVAVQGVLLNVAPIRHFARISLTVQALLLTTLLCGLPLVFSIPSLQNSMDQRPDWIVWIPPVWFLGLDPLEGEAKIALLDASGESIQFEAKQDSQLLVLNGEAIHEPVASYGPFVMNTREELAQAVEDYRAGKTGRLR
jgi:Pirin C-terminal cupin domain